MALILRGPASIDMAATAEGSAHVFTADAATTASWAPGSYWFSLRTTKGADVLEAGKGSIEVLPDLAAQAAGYDGRTQNEIALENINAVLAKRATRDQQRYTINNHELWRTPIADLIKLQAFYRAAVRREKAAKNGVSTFGRQVYVRFSG